MKKLYLLLLFLILTGCQKEELTEEPIEPESSGVHKTYVSKQDILRNQELMDAINTARGKIKTSEEQHKSGMGVFISGLYIDLGNAVYIEKGEYHSYTFPVKRKNDLTENLLVSLREDGSYRTILISYALNESDIRALENDEVIDLSTKTEFTLLDNSYFSKNTRFKSAESCASIDVVVERCDAGGEHSYEEIKAGAQCRDPSPPAPVYYFISYSADNCDADTTGWDGWSPGETGETGTGEGETGTGEPGPYNPPGGGPITTDPDPDPDPEPEPEPEPEPGPETEPLPGQKGDLTIPIPLTDETLLEFFFSTLGAEQKAWLLTEENQNFFEKEVAPFLVNNEFSSEAKDFAEEIIKAGEEGKLISAFPFFKYFDDSYATQYPKLTEYLKNKLPLVADMPVITDAITEITGLSLEKVKEDLQWDQGPYIKIIDFENDDLDETTSRTIGLFRSSSPDVVHIGKAYVDALESVNANQLQEDALIFYLGVVVLHEYVHYGDFYNGNAYQFNGGPDDEGDLFEINAYGKDLHPGNYEMFLIKWLDK